MRRQQAEGIIVAFSIAVFVFYHVWLFFIRGKGYKVKQKYHDFFAAGKLARSIWAEACATDEKDAILGVQQARNAMTSCTYLATVSVALATAGITILFDESKTQRIRQLSEKDPILSHYEGSLLAPPEAIIALALGSLYASFVCFAQSVRLYVHTGFYIRACTSRFNPGTLTVAEAKRVTIHAGMAFSVGLRLFYFFIPLIMWSLGPTYLLCSSVAMTALVAYMDHFDMSPDEEDTAREAELQQLMQQASGPIQIQVTAGPPVTTASSGATAATPGACRDGVNTPASGTNLGRLPSQTAAHAAMPAALGASHSPGLQPFATSLLPDEPPRQSSGRVTAAAALQRQGSAAQRMEDEFVANMV